MCLSIFGGIKGLNERIGLITIIKNRINKERGGAIVL